VKWIYAAAGIALYIKMLILPNPIADYPTESIVHMIARESGIPNTVSGILFRNRVYDTIFEVLVFTLAITGARFLIADQKPLRTIHQFSDQPSIVLTQLGATIAALISVELAIRGHLSPGGGFAAGVAGGTAIGLVAITASSEWIQSVYESHWNSMLEKLCVVLFIGFSALTLVGVELPKGTFGTLTSGGVFPF
jgi:multicomponent Na+:H+ antiporter subunit B